MGVQTIGLSLFQYWHQHISALLVLRMLKELIKDPRQLTTSLTVIFTSTSQKYVFNENSSLKRMVVNPKLGISESFIFSEWDADPSPKHLFCLLIEAKQKEKLLCSRHNRNQSFSLRKIVHYIRTECLKCISVTILYFISKKTINYKTNRTNTLSGSRDNIRLHYDLGNELFKKFLDKSMTYSCAIFKDSLNIKSLKDSLHGSEVVSADDLYSAQIFKYDTILDHLNLSSNSNVLEIGCGWGSLAFRAASRFDCKWTGLTISNAQFDYAKEQMVKYNLENNITLKLLDYREENGIYDHVIAIEMIEAVGHKYLPLFFKTVSKRLSVGGRLIIQSNICRDEEYKKYCKTTDFIRKYIFPGGHMPSVSSIKDSIPPELKIIDIEYIGSHYPLTLDTWYNSWLKSHNSISKMGYSETFFRKWEMYFSLCSALFTCKNIDVVKMVLVKTK